MSTSVRLTWRLRSPLPTKLTKRSYRELAGLTGLSHATLYRQLTGKSALTVQVAGRLACALKLTFDDMFEVVPELLEDVTPTTVEELTTPAPHEVRPSQPWLVTRAATYPRPTVYNLGHHPTPQELEAWEDNERQAQWANYRRHAQAGDFIQAAAAVGDLLRKKYSVNDLRTHLEKFGPFDEENSIAPLVKVSHI